MLEQYPLVRKIYLYLFALVGLTLIIIGSVRLIDLGLKILVFKHAEEDMYYRSNPPMPVEKISTVRDGGRIVEIKTEDIKLTDEEKQLLENWKADYKRWQEEQSKIDYKRASREREASNSIAFMIIGLPLYLYHWRIIRKETKNNSNISI